MLFPKPQNPKTPEPLDTDFDFLKIIWIGDVVNLNSQ